MLGQLDQSPELTVLERAVLRVALQGDTTAALREQVENATVAMRTPSGVGFVTKLNVGRARPRADGEAAIPRVYGRHPDLRSGAEFVVQVKDGRINSIEAFCYEGMWPVDETAFQLELVPQA
jgi:hypothetical protein